MKGKIWLIVSGVLALVVIAVVVVGIGVGSEASKLKDSMEAAVSHHAAKADIEQQLAGMGYKVADAAAPELKAEGGKHSLFVYNTWLTVDVKFDDQAKANAYHMDRASAWF